MNKHQMLFSRAKKAVEELFSDRSVSAEETIKSLEELGEEIEIRVEALLEDVYSRIMNIPIEEGK